MLYNRLCALTTGPLAYATSSWGIAQCLWRRGSTQKHSSSSSIIAPVLAAHTPQPSTKFTMPRPSTSCWTEVQTSMPGGVIAMAIRFTPLGAAADHPWHCTVPVPPGPPIHRYPMPSSARVRTVTG